ncbi:sugar ABC transporter ATP-binding protein [Nocardioides sp.]|uniref:sugar ABC transporter ATP-binding protein n=1 Tax=Nocardioides sp. TaxID=35761 RepID=UPI003D10B697
MAGPDTSAATALPGAVASEIGVGCRGLTRRFGNTLALDGVDLDVAVGSIHALVGQNGAGKSTCLGIIAGRIKPTSGEVLILGDNHQYGSPRAAQDAGVAAVYQELTVIPQLTPQANAFLPRPLTRGGLLRRGAMRRRYEQACSSLGTPPAPDVPVGRLTVAQQQLVEITRAVMSDSRILLLDEPTAALAPEERRALYRVLHSLRDAGSTIVLVSHNLDEVLANADAVTVFREGYVIDTRPASEWTKPELIESMIGDSSRDLLAAVTTGRTLAEDDSRGAARAAAAVRLKVDGIQLAGRLSDVSFEVRAGEVLGVVGLMGSGRSSLLRALSGLEPGTRGKVEIDGVSKSFPTSPRAAQALGIALLPEERKTQGVFLRMSAAENVALPRLRSLGRFGFLGPRRVESKTQPYLTAMGVSRSKTGHAAGTLSGGNQQKLLFARMSFIKPGVLLADEPTRGIDIGAKADILEEVRRLAREDGVAVVLVSSETEEVIAFSDRILVMAGGRIVDELDASKASEHELLQGAFNVDGVSAS